MKLNLFRIKPLRYLLLILVISFSLQACKEYLDVKPDKTRAIPVSLSDCQALLDNYSVMNTMYSIAGEASADNYFVPYAYLQSKSSLDRDFYLWSNIAEPPLNDWAQPYQVVFVANQVLETLDKYKLNEVNAQSYRELKGAALFYRAYAFYQLAQLYALPYSTANAAKPYGIPLRLTPNVNEPSVRSTVEETYQRIITDLQTAIVLLPRTISTKQSRPGKAAAYGAMARTYLVMADYSKAGLYADSALQINNTLLNYNDMSTSAVSPFARFNAEVVFHAFSIGSNLFTTDSYSVNLDLYNSYASRDLRQQLFYKNVTTNLYSFKGSYDNNYNTAPFTGIANDELYLIRAESFARSGNTTLAMKDLNDLLRTRWIYATPVANKISSYVDQTATNASQALEIILRERRKELVFRGLRWSDLRRLNIENVSQTTIIRDVNGTIYTLPPNDPRYTLLIPTEAINKTSMQQNPRN